MKPIAPNRGKPVKRSVCRQLLLLSHEHTVYNHYTTTTTTERTTRENYSGYRPYIFVRINHHAK